MKGALICFVLFTACSKIDTESLIVGGWRYSYPQQIVDQRCSAWFEKDSCIEFICENITGVAKIGYLIDPGRHNIFYTFWQPQVIPIGEYYKDTVIGGQHYNWHYAIYRDTLIWGISQKAFKQVDSRKIIIGSGLSRLELVR